MFEFRLPDVGEGVAEGELVRWLVEPGEEVTEDQPLAEVETDKAMVEVPSPVDGTVAELRAEEGELVPVGDVFVTIDPAEEVDEADVSVEPDEAGGEPARAGDEAAGTSEEAASTGDEAASTGDEAAAASGESGPDAGGDGPEPGTAGPGPDGTEAPTAEGRVFAAPSARRLARELGVDVGAVDGSGPGGRVTERDVREHAEAAESEAGAAGDEAVAEGESGRGSGADREPTAAEYAGGGEPAGSQAAEGEAGAGADTAGQVEPADRERTLAAPATRRVARELGVDVDAVPAVEERDGEAFVTEDAVREFAEAGQAAEAAGEAAASAGEGAAGAVASATGAAAGAAEAGEGVERVPYRGVRKTIGDAMVESKFTAPHVTHHEMVVVDDLVETRERLEPTAEQRGIRLTYVPFVMKAVVAALKEHPQLNAELDEEAGEILRKDAYHVGVATATDAGLMVPVVEDVDRKGLLQISSEVEELVQKARDRSITREELQGSTFTVTNFGAIGGDYATPILNYPEVGILGIGELKQRPVVEDDEVVARHTLPISLTIDHRVVDGADAARFAATFGEYVANPELLLLE